MDEILWCNLLNETSWQYFLQCHLFFDILQNALLGVKGLNISVFFFLLASIERFMDSLIEQKVPDNIVQDQPAQQQPQYMTNPNGPWYQNEWTYSKIGHTAYQNPPGWKRG